MSAIAISAASEGLLGSAKAPAPTRVRRAVVAACALGMVALIAAYAPRARARDARLGERADAPRRTLCRPDPALLVWDEDVAARAAAAGGPVTVRGWLRVPLLHESELLAPLGMASPSIALRVAAHTDCAPKRGPPILSHCGGPGSGNDCLDIRDLLPSLADRLDNLAISQRGVRAPADDAAPPPVPWRGAVAFPPITCYSPWAPPIVDAVRAAYAEASISAAPLDALLAAYSSPGGAMLYLYNATLVQSFAHLVAASANECRTRRAYTRLGGAGEDADARSVFDSPLAGRASLLDFASTTDLARDLDLLRSAVGAPRLSLWGTSYGTVVGGAYATMFPHAVGLLVLDGNVGVDDDVYKYGEKLSLAYDDVWNGLSAACDSTYFAHKEPLGRRCAAAPYASEKVFRLLSGGAGRQGAAQALQLLRRALDRGVAGRGVAPHAAIALACIQSLHTRADLSGPGCCAAPLFGTALPLPRAQWEDDEAIIQVVRALDMAGRLNPRTLARFYAELGARHPLGVQGATNIIYIAASPTLPRPTPPFGSTTAAPLIIGTLNDPATTYAAAQDMASFFPSGRLLTWQGYVHGFMVIDEPPRAPRARSTAADDDSFRNGGWGAYACTQLLKAYLLTGALPQDGTVCPIDGPGASSLALDVALAHVAAPPAVGSDDDDGDDAGGWSDDEKICL